MTPLEMILAGTFVVMTAVYLTAVLRKMRLFRPRDTSGEGAHPRVREASHDLSNEATKLRAVTRMISDSPDPLMALLKVMTGSRWQHDQEKNREDR